MSNALAETTKLCRALMHIFLTTSTHTERLAGIINYNYATT
jgi:hypothetical protein